MQSKLAEQLIPLRTRGVIHLHLQGRHGPRTVPTLCWMQASELGWAGRCLLSLPIGGLSWAKVFPELARPGMLSVGLGVQQGTGLWSGAPVEG